ncbi:uncharacterized [Tachysurus ichikawai]
MDVPTENPSGSDRTQSLNQIVSPVAFDWMDVPTENPSGSDRTQGVNHHDLLQMPGMFGVLCRTPSPAESTGDKEFLDAQLNLCMNR